MISREEVASVTSIYKIKLLISATTNCAAKITEAREDVFIPRDENKLARCYIN